MTKATKLVLVTFLVSLAFALGTTLPEPSHQPVVSGNADNHWDHSGNSLFTGSGITKVGIGTTSPQNKIHAVEDEANLAAFLMNFVI
jgi:hypothetical protein